MARPTIKDIARQVGVSATTVSRALRRDRRISQETIERVLEAAESVRYRPNIMARALVKSGNRLVGLLLRSIESSFFAGIIAGVQEILEPEGYSIILCNSAGEPAVEKAQMQRLIDKQVEGIIVTPTTTEGVNARFFNEVRAGGTPLVMIGFPKQGVQAPYVQVDNYLGGYLAASHLLRLGHRRLVYVSPRAEELPRHRRTRHTENIERFEGCRQACLEVGSEAELAIINAPGEQVDDRVISALLALDPAPTGLFVFSDMMALTLIRLLEARGHTVPEDYSCVGFDDMAFAALANPPLTTIAQPKQDLGRISARKLLAAINSRNVPETVIQPWLVERGTTLLAASPATGLGISRPNPHRREGERH